MKKTKTYMDKLMQDKDFREKFDEEYKNLCLAEQIAKVRHNANLTQEELAQRIESTKSAISRYENSNYNSYSVKLLNKIAKACNTDLQISFVPRGAKGI
ncbi:MAG: helix-turn-helix transcriptional regulator [Atribacterota bacterium]|nr:helix-turn-helix transcriptional regulator [Atribacterota bacterium]MDD4895375.1 helix-turn-helix transcriptional regulator [Atribacterota bacterium]MDD5637418.1 helix-turn-helix transcriptional regulator [Atribacterota bacterium]